MEKKPIEDLTLDELCVVLSEATLELLKLIEEKADGFAILSKKKEVENLQAVIQKKKGST
jgi:hypothetical protein